MTIKRQYSLPNCKLILEGVGEEDSTGLAATARPPISVLVNAECHLIGVEKPLTGGREFLDGLVAAVSQYAQEYLSGIRHPMDSHSKGLVQLRRIKPDTHQLTVYSHAPRDHESGSGIKPLQMEISTVQLFDLVEAVDQLCADTQTLPDLNLSVAPISRRYIASQEPIAKRALPAALGVSSLAIAAGLLFLVPVPQVRRPEPAQTGANQESPESLPAASAASGATGATPPDTATETPTSPVEANSIPPTSPSPEASEAASSPSAAEPDADSSTSAASSEASVITEPTQLSRLKQGLRSDLDEAWETRPNFEQDLIYRVSVAENGDILGFRYINDDAVRYVNQTPLLDLRYNQTTTTPSEPVAEFRVVFTPDGAVEVSPWHGVLSSPSPSP
jgi:hypothetical protein